MLISPHIAAICQTVQTQHPPILPFLEPQVKWLVIGGQNTAAMATSCLANSPLAEGGETGLWVPTPQTDADTDKQTLEHLFGVCELLETR